MKLFRRKNEVTLNRIHHTVTINENGEKLKLTISADPMRIVAGLSKAQKKLNETISKENPTDEDIREAAEFFATVLLGKNKRKRCSTSMRRMPLA